MYDTSQKRSRRGSLARAVSRLNKAYEGSSLSMYDTLESPQRVSKVRRVSADYKTYELATGVNLVVVADFSVVDGCLTKSLLILFTSTRQENG